MQISEIFHKKINLKLVDATLFYLLSIVIFSFLAYVLALWQLFYDQQGELQIVSDQNPGVALIELQQEGNDLKGAVSGHKARFIYGQDIIIPDKEGNFVLPLRGG